MKPTKAELTKELAAAKAALARAEQTAETVARWLLRERTKAVVGETEQDREDARTHPGPVVLWRAAQELIGDQKARRIAHETDNDTRKKLGMPQRPASDDPWLTNRSPIRTPENHDQETDHREQL